MAQAKPLAVVVEEDPMQRDLAAVVLEECEMRVIPCETAEAAKVLFEALERQPVLLFIDVRLSGVLTGAELAHLVRAKFPEARVIVTSGDEILPPLPEGTRLMPNPWYPLELIREATALGAQHTY